MLIVWIKKKKTNNLHYSAHTHTHTSIYVYIKRKKLLIDFRLTVIIFRFHGKRL